MISMIGTTSLALNYVLLLPGTIFFRARPQLMKRGMGISVVGYGISFLLAGFGKEVSAVSNVVSLFHLLSRVDQTIQHDTAIHQSPRESKLTISLFAKVWHFIVFQGVLPEIFAGVLNAPIFILVRRLLRFSILTLIPFVLS